jgi:hypothetical protein
MTVKKDIRAREHARPSNLPRALVDRMRQTRDAVAVLGTRRRLCGSILAAAALACLLLPAAADAATAPTTPPNVVISPLPGTPDANPTTQISFLGVPASRVRDIVVTGSISGRHRGRLDSYSTDDGGSFLPSRAFTPGESVTVTATVFGYGAPARTGTTFTVSRPYSLPPPTPGTSFAATQTNTMRFQSRTDLEPPAVTVTTPSSDPSLGDIFVSPDSGPGEAGPMIVNPAGQLVWFDPMRAGTSAFDLNMQSYDGAPVLTWWQGETVEGHGQGEDVIESDHYTPVATVHAGNGLYADLHDFVITPQGTAWITAFAPQHVSFSSLGGTPNGLIDDSVVQEIDIKTGLVMFQWDALGHVPIADTYMRIPHYPGEVLDYFHINTIDPLADGPLLISSRSTWAAYLIDETSGAVLWTLGGRQSTFSLPAGDTFAWQHDVELLPNGTISLFDNESAPPEAKQSRVLDISLDTASDTATVVSQLTYPAGSGILSASQGSVQQLADGNDFVGWGQAGDVSELSPEDQLIFDMHFATPASTYRAFAFPWSAQPLTAPALKVSPGQGATTAIWASWNGATDVASWRVLAGSSRRTLQAVGTYPSSGFETAIAAPTTDRLISVQAVSAAGAVLASSPVTKR